MYRNLKAEMARQNLSVKALAARIGVAYSTLSQKIGGKTEFTFAEAVAIKRVLGVSMPLESLFERVA